MKTSKILYTIALAIVLLAGGSAAWAASSFTVTNTSGTSKFVITRTSNNSTTETVQYRTVSLSAIAGKHFTEKTGNLTFDATHNSYEVEVTETPSGSVEEQYHFQTGTTRSYRFEVLDQGGFRLAYTDRSITYGTTYQHSASYVNKSITDLVYFNNGSLASGGGNKYLDVAHSGTSGSYKMIDDGYDYNDNTLCTISTGSLYNNNSTLRTYLNRNYNNYKMYATVYFTMYEEDDGYQYIQILTDNSSTYDGKDGDGKIDNGPDKSVYKAAFILTKSEDHCTSDHYQAFPHRYDYKNRTEGSQTASHTEFEYADSYLYQQKFYSDSYRADNSGSLILSPTVNNINVRFDANGGGDDTWYVKNLKVRLALVDSKAPSVLSYSVAPGMHAKGNTVYVSVAFSEIVTGTTSMLTSNWGDLSYVAGSGSNVLTFSRTIPASASSSLNITGYSGITDLAGNAPSSVSATGICAVDASHTFTITYNLNDGTVATDNPTSYTWETAAFTLNNPARTGYWFDGWTGSNGNTPQTTVTISNHSHGNRTYTANWTKVWTGSGTQGDPYEITTTKGLDLLAMYVNGLGGNTAHNCSGVYFQLGDDIAYTYTDAWNLASSQEDNYTAIGTDSNNFSGTFDGQNHTISGIRLYRGGSNSADKYHGIFGYIGSGGTVRGVNLADARITGNNSVGGIVGYSFYATVEDCTVAADVCIHAVQSDSDYHGGIVGSSQGTVQRCLSRATLTANYTSACDSFGGIVGSANVSIQDCLVFEVTVPDVTDRGALIGVASSTVRRNYYRNCTVADVPGATGVGVGYSTGNNFPHDIDQGAQALYSITLPDGVTLVRSASATLPGTGNATYTTGADIDGTPYAFDGATLRLSYTGAALAAGYVYGLFINGTRATDNGNGTYTATMPAADATITVSIVPIDFTADGHSGDSEADAYIIYNKDQLDLLAKMVNGTDGYDANTFENKFIKLANDIDYHPNTTWNDATGTEHNYTVIGKYDYPFKGVFDGGSHIISGIRIYKSGSDSNNESDNNYLGLFGRSFYATIKNVTLTDARITGYRFVGGIVGFKNRGQVVNCHVTNTVAIHGVVNQSCCHGGLVGYSSDSSSDKISGCTSAATISIAGGLTGCYGNGGIIGKNNRSTIENCLSIGVTLSGNSEVGVIAGSDNRGTYTSNYYLNCTVGDIANATNVGVGGESSSSDQAGARSVHALTLPAGITASGESVDIDATTYYAAGTTVTLSHGSAPAGYETFEGYSLDGTPFDGNTFTMPAADATVTARWTTKDFTSDHEGTEADPFIIYNKDQLNQLASLVNNGACNGYSKKFIKLGADIEYDGTENNFTPIGNNPNAFRGTFDGDGHTISGIVITGGNDYQGLFGHISNVSKIGAVKNLTLANSSISGKDYVGGIVGRSASLVSNCHVENSVTIKTGNNNSTYHGGIVGQNNGTIQGCISSASVLVNGWNGCKKYGGITGGSASNKTIENCLAAGAIVENTASSGAIVGETASYLRHNYYSDCSIGEASSNVGCYMDSRTSSIKYGDITDNDGAIRAVSSTTKPAEIGAQIATYSGGLTVYEHGAYYNGTYYLRHDLAGTAVGLTLTQGTKDGVSAYWGTYYNGTTNHTLVGATAYTLGSDYKLYRLGTDGRTIPKGVAVVIIATSGDASLIPAGTGNLSITDPAPGGNILVGNDADTFYTAIYVLSVNGSGEIGFRKLDGGTLPAHKAGYERRAGMQDYDKQDNQEW